MNHRRLFGIALLFPYLFWGVGAAVVYPLQQADLSANWNFILMPVMFYVVGVILWFIPYTLLAAGMWIWSRDRTVPSLRKSGLLAPVLFSILITIEYAVINWGIYAPEAGGETMIGFLALLVGSGLSFGYLFVGIALAVYKLLRSNHLITEDN